MGADQNYGSLFGPLDFKENTVIQTPERPIILIDPHILCFLLFRLRASLLYELVSANLAQYF